MTGTQLLKYSSESGQQGSISDATVVVSVNRVCG